MMIQIERTLENVVLSQKTVIARSFIDRAFGLIIRNFNENLDCMIFENCNLIHSCFMRYKFDLVFVAESGEIVKMYESAAPFKIFYGGKNRKLSALELPEGTIEKFKLTLGEVLKIEEL